jgi:hypothetical protein
LPGNGETIPPANGFQSPGDPVLQPLQGVLVVGVDPIRTVNVS